LYVTFLFAFLVPFWCLFGAFLVPFLRCCNVLISSLLLLSLDCVV